MATPRLTQDFSEFLRLLNSHRVEYLLIGGYAVNCYGLNRPTKDMDIWIAIAPDNIARVLEVLHAFGFARGSVNAEHFQRSGTIFRMGVPPNRLELFTGITGVEFDGCYARRKLMQIEDGLDVPVIAFEDLKANKLATGRASDLGDIEKLEAGIEHQ